MTYPTSRLFLVVCLASAAFGQKPGKMSIELSIPHTRELPFINLCSEKDGVFVILRNNTDSTNYFYEDWNSYGYYNISFEIRQRDSIFPLVRQQKIWYRNFPSYSRLHPGESLVFPHNLIDTICSRDLRTDGIFATGWLGFPPIADTVEIRAVYQLCHQEDVIPEGRITRLNYRKEDYIDYLEGDIEEPFDAPKPIIQSESPPQNELIFHEILYSNWQKVILLR